MVEIRPLKAGDLLAVAADIKEADMIELRATSNLPPAAALQESIDSSNLTLTFHNGDEVLGIFGYQARHSGAVVWMVSTPEISKCSKSFTKQAKSIMDEWAQRFPMLWNYVYSGNKATIEWLEFLGFHIHSTVPSYGTHNEPYHCMVRERK